MLVVDSAVKLVENIPEEEGEPQKRRELRGEEIALCDDCSRRGNWREEWMEKEVMMRGVVEVGEGEERVYCKRGSMSVAVVDVGEDEGEGFER